MKYTVLWVSKAERELTTIWLNAANRTTITEAAAAIDLQLQSDPEDVGESRADDCRILLISPLGVKYDILPDDRAVRVLKVWRFAERRRK